MIDKQYSSPEKMVARLRKKRVARLRRAFPAEVLAPYSQEALESRCRSLAELVRLMLELERQIMPDCRISSSTTSCAP